jgi:hypothetical protein
MTPIFLFVIRIGAMSAGRSKKISGGKITNESNAENPIMISKITFGIVFFIVCFNSVGSFLFGPNIDAVAIKKPTRITSNKNKPSNEEIWSLARIRTLDIGMECGLVRLAEIIW